MPRARDGAAAAAYHAATIHTPHSVGARRWVLDWDNRPDPLKRYSGLERIHLADPEPVPGVSGLDAIAGVELEGRGHALDAGGLSRILAWGAGVIRTRVFPGGDLFHFRTYACAGALYPVEVYLVCGGLDGLGAGVYHFDPLEKALTVLRRGDHRGSIAGATGGISADAQTVIVLTGIPWRTAWKYTERGYRHLFWDAGMILANMAALAASAGLPHRVVTGFADGEVEALLGLDGRREFPLCLLGLGAGAAAGPAGSAPGALEHRASALSPREVEFPAILAANDAGRLRSGEEAVAWRGRAGRLARSRSPAGSPGPDRAGGLVGGGAEGSSIETVIRRRGSARTFASGSIPKDVLADILARATAGVATDLGQEGSRLVSCYLIANDVGGLPAGAHLFEGGAFRLLWRGDFRGEAAFLCLGQALGGQAAATHFLMADLDGVLAVLGDRGYRVAQIEGGIVAGRIYLGAYAHGFGATGLTFYDEEVGRFFSQAAGTACILAVAVGASARRLS